MQLVFLCIILKLYVKGEFTCIGFDIWFFSCSNVVKYNLKQNLKKQQNITN